MGAAAGVYLFVRGFLLLARQRLLAHTPTARICNASAGLLELSGSATGSATLRAPITGEQCFLYRTIARQPSPSQRSVQWEKVAEETQCTPFFLSDETGQLAVNPEGAELDLVEDFREEFNVSAFSTNDELPPEVTAFLSRYGVVPHGRIRIEEWTVTPNQALFALGTVTENSGMALKQSASAETASPDRPVSLDQSPPSTPAAIRLSQINPAAPAAEMTLQGKIAAALVKAGIQNTEVWETPAVLNRRAANQPAPQLSQLVINGMRSTGAENASPKFVLGKGAENPTFLISWRSRQDVIRSLTWKSFAMIWGGIGLILVGAYVLFL